MFHVDIILAMLFGISVAMPVDYFSAMWCRRRKGENIYSRDLRKLEGQLPAFLDTISSNLSVGHSLQQALEASIRKNNTNLGVFFEAILLRVKSGMTLDHSLELQSSDLTGSSLSLVLLSMASSYRSGSNMIESLSLLSSLCREREFLRKKILARTAQSRMQGSVLIFVPVLFMLLLFVVSPQNMIPVLNTATGRILLGSAALLQLLGGFSIRALLKQEII
jgi:tight adherence protein B